MNARLLHTLFGFGGGLGTVISLVPLGTSSTSLVPPITIAAIVSVRKAPSVGLAQVVIEQDSVGVAFQIIELPAAGGPEQHADAHET